MLSPRKSEPDRCRANLLPSGAMPHRSFEPRALICWLYPGRLLLDTAAPCARRCSNEAHPDNCPQPELRASTSLVSARADWAAPLLWSQRLLVERSLEQHLAEQHLGEQHLVKQHSMEQRLVEQRVMG